MEENNTPAPSSFIKLLNPLPILLGLVGLLPFFGIPFFDLPIAADKAVFFTVAVIVALMVWLIARLMDGTFVFPQTKILLVAGLIVVATLLSTLLSGAIRPSFFGGGAGETGSFFFMLLSFALVFLGAISFQSAKHFFYFFFAILASFIAVFLLQAAHFLGAFDALGPLQSTFIARWNDLAVFFGFVIVLGLVLLDLFPFERLLKWLTGVSVALALLGGVILNFRLFWWTVGISAVIIFIYGFVYRLRAISTTNNITEGATAPDNSGTQGVKAFLRPSLFVVALSAAALLLMAPGSSVDQWLTARFPAPIEVRPSVNGTLGVIKATLDEDPILGVGPNRFFTEWVKNRPAAVNEGPFWNVDFNYGVGRIPTFIVTNGILGIVLWLLFLGLLFYYGAKTLFAPLERPFHALAVAIFAGMAYLWALNIVYVPDLTLVALTFITTGVFIALLARLRFIKTYSFSLANEPGYGFGAVIAIILLLIFSFAGGYIGLKKYAALAYAQRGLTVFGASGDVDVLGENLSKAAKLDAWDFYYRNLSDAYLLRMQEELAEPNLSDEVLRNRFTNAYAGVLNNAFRATEIDPENYLNWIALGNVYETVALPPFRIPGAYEEARKRYERAGELNPTSPIVPFRIARLEAGMGNYNPALELLSRALAIKANYTPALFLASQIEVERGNLDTAIEKAEQASLISPNDIGVLFQLGFLYYRDGDYRKAVTSLERAVGLNSTYSNAKYFLGLSYERLGQDDAAIKQFEQILLLNPDHEGVKDILANLRAGRSPFAGLPAPDSSPELGAEPPIDEEEE